MRYNNARPLLILLFLAVYQWVAFAQTTAKPVVLANTEKREITSSKIGQKYDLLVSLPSDYATTGKKYPVLYVLDGWHFPLLNFIQDNSAFSGKMPPVIVVNISHGELPWEKVSPLRTRDFTPGPAKRVPYSGGAAAFLDFFENELIPYVDNTYRTDKTDRGILGHSYGGVFALYALENRPALFQRIVAASPAIGNFHELMFLADKLKNIKSPVRLDLSAGEDEVMPAPDSLRSETEAFASLLKQSGPANLEYRLTIYKGENHDSVRLSSFPAGLYWVYRSEKQK